MEEATKKRAVFSCCYDALPLNAITTWPTNNGTSHMKSSSILLIFAAYVKARRSQLTYLLRRQYAAKLICY